VVIAADHSKLIDQLKSRASTDLSCGLLNENFSQELEQAFLIRCVEKKFLTLFGEAKVSGTVHTCIGQEMTGVAVARFLQPGDWMTSNHRCHGHYIAKTGDWEGLVDELLGLSSGVSKGIGSSQHLYNENFISNGTQGSLLPVASGLGLSNKNKKTGKIAVSFIGEGTLGEGNVYEAMNLSSLFESPHLIVCENNYYSQTTPQGSGVAGSINLRATAFGLEYFEADTWNIGELMKVCERAVSYVRNNSKPAFLKIDTYRLMAHSKGDDDRDPAEVEYFADQDPLNRIRDESAFKDIFDEIERKVHSYAEDKLLSTERINYKEYSVDQLPRATSTKQRLVNNDRVSMVRALQRSYAELARSKGAVFIGEDIADPYGGAFKVTKGIQTELPGQVLSTSISEAGLVGLAIGMTLEGDLVFAEIMFGDFIVNAMDQLINNASKFHHMYGQQISCNVTVRTPMGGRRGYGPTHSQSLDKFVLGIDNTACIALCSLIDPASALSAITDLQCPKVLIENKTDYSSFLFKPGPGLSLECIGGGLGTVKLSPMKTPSSIAVVCYGYLARMVADNYEQIFKATDTAFTLIAPQLIHPLPLSHFERALKSYEGVVVAEEGTAGFGWVDGVTAELLSLNDALKVERVASDPIPIPSHRETELKNLVSVEGIIDAIKSVSKRCEWN
jgi:2-oxoisovalerate dehydrogenase E1 component